VDPRAATSCSQCGVLARANGTSDFMAPCGGTMPLHTAFWTDSGRARTSDRRRLTQLFERCSRTAKQDGELDLAVPVALHELGQKPAVFQGRAAPGRLELPHLDQGRGFLHGQDHGLDDVPAEPLERGDPQVAVHQHVLLPIRHHQHRALLALPGQRGLQAGPATGLGDAKSRVAPFELVELQLQATSGLGAPSVLRAACAVC